jgi:hypothetical protein
MFCGFVEAEEFSHGQKGLEVPDLHLSPPLIGFVDQANRYKSFDSISA